MRIKLKANEWKNHRVNIAVFDDLLQLGTQSLALFVLHGREDLERRGLSNKSRKQEQMQRSTALAYPHIRESMVRAVATNLDLQCVE